MSVLEWKTFNFFKLEAIDNNAKYINIASSVTAHCGNATYKIFCSSKGAIHIFLADWECISFQATNNPIIACAIPDDSDFLVIVEQNSAECIIKCYSVLKLLDRKTKPALCYATLEKNSRVIALNVCFGMDALVWIAVGIERGTVVLYKASLSRNVLTFFRTLQVCLNPIRGIAFIRQNIGEVKMCVCADIGVFYYSISLENCIETKHVFNDDDVKSVQCCTLMPANESNGEPFFVVGRMDALYCFTSEGRGPCFAINGTKETIKWFGKHIYVVLKLNGTAPENQQSPEARSQIIIINIDNNMIVFNEVLSEISCLFPAQLQTKCLIFMKDGTIYTLRDQGIGYKVQLLCEKNLYDIALKLVEEQNVHPSIIASVNARYADYLLQRGYVDASVKMFIRTIGYISPFRVINKLLNIRYNEYIIEYLKVLIDTGNAYSECRSLHQNCCRRMDLPTAIDQIFSKQPYKYNYDNISTEEPNDKAYNLSTLLNDSGSDMNSIDYSAAMQNGIVKISPQYEQWIVSNWPLNPRQILEDLAIDDSLREPDLRDKVLQLLLSLLFPNKDTLLDIISSIYSEHKPHASVNIIWAEILMQMWKSQALDADKVLEFFRKQKLEMNEDVHIICHTHKFWPGIKMVHDGNEMDTLTMPWANPSEISSKGVSYQMLIQTLRKEYHNSNHSSEVFQQVMSNIFHRNPHNMLTVIEKVATTSAPFNVSHINSVLTKDVIMKRLALQSYDDIPTLELKLSQIKSLLKGYLKSPIEFRNSSCDACKQPLKQPSVYFSCQHAYHKECMASFSEINSCLVCKNNLFRQRTESDISAKKKEVHSQFSTFRNISNKLTLSSLSRTRLRAPKIVGTQSTNPFEDVNTNPFA